MCQIFVKYFNRTLWQGGLSRVFAESMVSLDFDFPEPFQLKKVVNELLFDLISNLVLQYSFC